MNKEQKLILFGLITVALFSVPAGFASSSLGDEWNSLKSELSNAVKAETQQDSLMYLDTAKSIYVANFKKAAQSSDPESDKLIENAFLDSEKRLKAGDVAQASLNQQIIDKTIYKIAFVKLESAIQQNNSEEFLRWYDIMEKKFKISEKEYNTNSILPKIQSDATSLSIHGPAITEELLEIFKLKTIEELEEAIAALDEGNIKDAQKFTYEGLYYYRTLHPSVEEKLGSETANELLHEMEEAVEVTTSNSDISHMTEELKHISSEVELIIREYEGGDTSETGLALSGIKDRLNLVEEEYAEAVKDGKIVNQEEYDETIVFLAKASEIFNQNKMTFMELSQSETSSLDNNLKEIDNAVTMMDDPSQVSILVGKSINNISSLTDLAGGSIQIDTVEYIVEIEHLLNQAKKEYRSGNSQMAFDLVTEAYLDNYEFVEGPLGEADHELMEKIETDMREDLRSMIKSNSSPDAVDNQIDMILADLTEAKKVVPEFGTIAIMILVVAIISIIAITAKSRISLRV